MDFKAEQMSKVDASVIWQAQVGTRDNCGVAHVEHKQIFEVLSCGSSKIIYPIRFSFRDCSPEEVCFQPGIFSVIQIQVHL